MARYLVYVLFNIRFVIINRLYFIRVVQMKYLVYLRVSTEEQDVETQMQMCKDRMHSIHPNGKYSAEYFIDPDMSSGVALERRVELQRLLSSIKKGDTVLVYKLDRLSRDIIEMVTIYRLIVNKLAAHVISLNDPYSDEFSVGLMGLIAQKERDTIRMRTRDKLSNKKKKGERYSRYLPYGYGMHETKLVPIKVGKEVVLKRGVLVPIVEEQRALVLMRELSAEGKSYQSIATLLTQLGYMNREGKPFQKMSIYRILSRKEDAMSLDQPQEEREAHLSHS